MKKDTKKTAAAKTAPKKETFRGRVAHTRKFQWTDKNGEKQPGGEVILVGPTGKRCHVQLYHESIGHVDGLWLDPVTWLFVVGEKINPGQYVQAYGYPENKGYKTKAGEDRQEYRIKIYDPDALTVFQIPTRPNEAPADEKAARPLPKRPI